MQKNIAKLSVLSGLPEKSVHYVKNRFTIGRDIDNTLSISKNTVSRHHAMIEWKEKEDSFYVYDEGSENGVVVNGRMILGKEKLKSNDIIFISDVEIRFEEAPYSKDLLFEEDKKDLPPQGMGAELTETHFIDIAELKPEYFEKLREDNPKPKWIWDDNEEEEKEEKNKK
jgi:pSer/pThr/pTyr-binding forkhead associated (FHA) protein